MRRYGSNEAMTNEQQDTPLSESGRLAGVFLDPARAFPDIAERGRWWLVALLLILMNVAALSAMVSRVG